MLEGACHFLTPSIEMIDKKALQFLELGMRAAVEELEAEAPEIPHIAHFNE